MCRLFLILLALLQAVSFCCAQPFADSELRTQVLATGLPLLHVITNSGNEPTCTIVPTSERPPGCVGIGVRNKIKERGVCSFLTDAEIIDSCTINVRGNSSAASIKGKKAYKLKLDKKRSLIAGVAPQKEWLLIREDSSAIRTEIGFKVNKLIHPTWTPSLAYVNLIINEDYKGLYVLENAMTDDIVPNGFIAEWDPYWWNDEFYIDTPMHQLDPRVAYTFKFFSDEAPDVLVAYDNDIIQQNLIDYRSAAEWLLCHDLLGSRDGLGSNIFLFYQQGKPLRFGCLWDFDAIFQKSEDWSSEHNLIHFVHLLKNPDFVDCYIALYDSVRNSNFVQKVTDLAYLESIEQAWLLDNERWKSRLTISQQIEQAKNWFKTRFATLDPLVDNMRAFMKACSLSTGASNTHGYWRVNERVVVYDGKKFFVPLR